MRSFFFLPPRILFRGIGGFLVAAVLALGSVAHAQAPDVTCRSEMVPMRDGTLLATDIYTPAAPGKYPVVLVRNPYGRLLGAGCFTGLGASVVPFVQNGYVGVVQEARGTFRSEGTFNAMVQEANDGYDAVEWAAAQPWSTGKVGMMSGSYLGLTQWQPAIQTPPHLAAIAPAITASDYHDNWTYVNGVFDLWFGLSWPALAFVPDYIVRTGQAQGLPPEQIDQQVAAWTSSTNDNLLNDWIWQLPLTSFPTFRESAPYYYDWLAHPSYDAFWKRMDVEAHWDKVNVPALNSGAWYDIFAVGTVRNYHGMRAEGATPEARQGTKLVMNAYGHAGDSGTPTFGNDAADPALTMKFFDRYLKGIENGWENDPAVHLYVLVPPDTGDAGTGFWISGADFPLPGSDTRTLYLTSGGNANTRFGDGALVPLLKGRANGNPDRFSYDPLNPVPTAGGNMCCNNVLPNGAQEQSEVELREDVLVYTSAPLEADVAVIGPVEVKLWAQSSARDTDFTAKLVDVHVDGKTHNVLDRVVRARYRHGSKAPPSPIQPGKPYEYTIPLGNTATIFRKGHRIRLQISSSNFPHYARNLNTGLSNEETAQTEIAHQTVRHNAAHRSRLVFTVAPGVTVPAGLQ